jgi:MOSC domain-containing protein YiiM
MSIERIFISPSAGSDQSECRLIELVAGQGIVNDRNFGKTAYPGQNITLVEAEEIERFCRQTGRPPDLSMTRRNLVVRGIRLNDLVGRQFRIGDSVLVGVELCEPCRTLSHRLANASLTPAAVLKYWVGRGGLRADVVRSGSVSCGDALTTSLSSAGGP